MTTLSFKLEEHPALKYAAQIRELCQPLEKIGITTFCHIRCQDEKSFSTLFTMTEAHVRNYLQKEYHNADIHIAPGYHPELKCVIWDALELKGQAYDMVKDAFDFGYKHIFTLVKNRPQHIDYYHFGTHLSNVSINQLYINHLDLLEKFIEYFQTKINASPELSSAYQLRIPIQKSSQERCKDPSFHWLSIEAQQEVLSLIQGSPRLTPREQNYLPLLIKGYTAKEMAKLLHLSPRTVEDQIHGMKEKFKAKNKAELVAKLARKDSW